MIEDKGFCVVDYFVVVGLIDVLKFLEEEIYFNDVCYKVVKLKEFIIDVLVIIKFFGEEVLWDYICIDIILIGLLVDFNNGSFVGL